MSQRSTEALPLVAILVLAALLRVWGLTWGLPSATHYFSYHPDESRVLQVAMFNMNLFAGRLLPHFYNYGSLQLYLVNFANSLAFVFGGVDIMPKDFPAWYPQWARMYLIGRCLTVGMGVGTVWATYALGRLLWGRRAGLLAALLLAITPLHAQHSHWLTVDVPATFWVVLSLVWTTKLATGDVRPLRAALWAGVFAGLAAATKYNMALVLAPLAAACLLAPPIIGGRGGTSAEVAGYSSRLRRLSVGLGAAVIAFLIACPGSVLESRQFLADLRFEAVHVSNTDDPTFKDTGSGFVYHVTNNLAAGLGVPLLLLALVSVVYAAYRRERGDGLLAAFALPYYAVISLAAVRYARYVIPLLPILALWGGRLLADASHLRSAVARRAGLVAGGVILTLTLANAWLLVRPMADLDNRDWALRWINALAPAPATVGFAAMPWFGSPPISPYFPAPLRGGWRAATPPQDAARIVYEGQDWDIKLLLSARPAVVVLSEYDYDDALRLKDPAAIGYLDALRQGYTRRFVLSDPASAFSAYGTVLGMPTRGLPHDMLYSNPIISIYQRK